MAGFNFIVGKAAIIKATDQVIALVRETNDKLHQVAMSHLRHAADTGDASLIFRMWSGLGGAKAPLATSLRKWLGEHTSTDDGRSWLKFTEQEGFKVKANRPGEPDWSALRKSTADRIEDIATLPAFNVNRGGASDMRFMSMADLVEAAQRLLKADNTDKRTVILPNEHRALLNVFVTEAKPAAEQAEKLIEQAKAGPVEEPKPEPVKAAKPRKEKTVKTKVPAGIPQEQAQANA